MDSHAKPIHGRKPSNDHAAGPRAATRMRQRPDGTEDSIGRDGAIAPVTTAAPHTAPPIATAPARRVQ